MSVFGNYSKYYDLLYKDKDYESEAAFVDSIIKKHIPHANSILDLGCGTGKHGLLMAKKGYQVSGVDQSAEMLSVATEKAKENPAITIDLHQGDIRTVQLGRQFDVVMSLFHVVSYMSSNEDLENMFNVMAKHVEPGGIIIFDAWYGPAVLTNQPTVRIKRLEDQQIQVARISEPVLNQNDNVVDVNYDVFITDKLSQHIEELKEMHRMRYLFHPEVLSLIHKYGFSPLEFGAWLTGKQPTSQDWGVYWVGKKTR